MSGYIQGSLPATLSLLAFEPLTHHCSHGTDPDPETESRPMEQQPGGTARRNRKKARGLGIGLKPLPRLWAILIFGVLTHFFPIQSQPAHAQEPSAPTWEDLQSRPFPRWFVDAKLGIFIHWGVYSVPAFSGTEDYAEWFLSGLQEGDPLRTTFMREHFGEGFTYRDFATLFRP